MNCLGFNPELIRAAVCAIAGLIVTVFGVAAFFLARDWRTHFAARRRIEIKIDRGGRALNTEELAELRRRWCK